MNLMNLTDLIGYLAGILLMWSFLPQVIKSLCSRQVDDLSLSMLIITLASGLLYEVYAWRLDLLPVLIMNGGFVLLVLAQLLITLRYRGSRDD